jgi:DNA modification methylase
MDNKDVRIIPLKLITVSPDRGRKDFSKIGELMNSIQTHGLLHPLVVEREGTDGKYVLVAGECRLRCLVLLGKAEAPCNVLGGISDVTKKEIELTENLARTNLSWEEQSEIYRQIDELKRTIHGSKMQGGGTNSAEGWSLEKTAALVGKSTGFLSKQINLAKTLKARPDIKEKVKALPLTAAIRRTEQLLEQERLVRLKDAGKLEVNQIVTQGDARELVKLLPKDSIDLILTDGPFGVDALNSCSSNVVGVYRDFAEKTDNLDASLAAKLYYDIAPELYRVLKPTAHIYMFTAISPVYFHICRALEIAGFVVAPAPLVWYKGRGTSAFKGTSYVASYEAIIFAYKPPRPRILAEACKDVLTYSPVPPKRKHHIYEKPQELLRYLIGQSSNLGDTVLDCFAGGGSTIVASFAMGRKALGFEISGSNYNAIQQRLTLGEDYAYNNSSEGNDPTTASEEAIGDTVDDDQAEREQDVDSRH